MTLTQRLFRQVLLPSFETGLKGRAVMRHWRELERTQWLSPSELATMQLEALRRIIAHAYDSCPYYRSAWSRLGIAPGALRTLSDFQRWPVTDRSTVREHRVQLRSTRPMQLITKATGGSSGDPLVFHLDHGSNDRRMAAWHRGYGWAGAAPGTSQLHLWGVPIGRQPLRKRLKDRLYHSLYRRRMLSCFEMGEGFAERFAGEVARRSPDAIVAYTNPLYEVATQLEQAGTRVAFSPKAIVVGAEKLHSFQRERIERVFGAPVFETYGSREFMLIGAECEQHKGLHITAEHLLVEVLDESGRPAPAGTEGNVVITDLFNYGMPFIRCANGDRAVAGAGPCACGRGLPLLEKVTGRVLDLIRTPDGTVLPGEFFPHLLKDFAGVRRFQVIQEDLSSLRILLMADALSQLERSRLEALVRGAVGTRMRVDLEVVTEIPLTASGKHAVVRNRLKMREAA